MNLSKLIFKYELEKISLLFIILFVIFKIAFFKTSFYISLKLVFSLFLLIVLPGYFLTLFLRSNWDFLERVVIGASLSFAIFTILAYYMNLFEIHIKFYSILIPAIVILIGSLLNYKSSKNL